MPKNPTPAPSTPPLLNPEIRQLRHLITQVRRHINSGQLDYLAGATFITKASTTLAHLLLAQYRIAPPTNDTATEIRREWDRILTDMGLGPR